ncbi:DNA sulfur modification protein DndB [Antrihabitans sp. YC2-6]|uniref:DNA sulfur modification protein DndB n=1 Tax=Antrihabitans sp. YC2-6 TaxID=2799498 RepID=UPI0018F33EDC|nr:DNA sulfur modification protein DndB [Antrihabitans sp. YC2-6]MBJ8348841.1 hypothetical protein [Antrihabitans sp. YC2-6]
MVFQLAPDSALDLTLQGTVGSFRVGTGQVDAKSLEVKYLLTHVGLNFAAATNDKLLSALAPVREIFDSNSLEFDEIMQRDIDDARVSADLVPYLLDDQARDMIKLFPPIVIVVLPIKQNRVQPDAFYPKVTIEVLEPLPNQAHNRLVTRSGSVGSEVFEFEQPFVQDVSYQHDLVRLRLNTSRTRLVIVDGQHRAMALLAIYRNLKDEWSDSRRAPFREYYSSWTKNYIEQFALDEINLPVLICTVPELDAAYAGDFDMKKAARSIFLTLNKTARKVSDSRNKLLDDNDIISVMMRRTLSQIKAKDERSQYSLRMENIELDQEGSRQKIQTPVAISGVPHIYYMTEHMMLDSGTDIRGVKPRSGTFANRRRLDDLLDRLDGRNLLGATGADAIRRDLFTASAARDLGRQFDLKYGTLITGALEKFGPFERHNLAVLKIGQELERNQDRQLKPILLEGQGIGRVFESHRAALRQRINEGYFKVDVPEIRAILARLDATAGRIEDAVKQLRAERATNLLGDISDKRALRDKNGELHSKMVDWCNKLYEDVLTTVAFQVALVCGFVGLVEKAELRIKSDPDPEAVNRDDAYEDYIAQLNAFFTPKTTAQLKKMIRVFSGEPESDNIWSVRVNNQTFRSVVFRAEMQPDQWPKYRYLLLEVWDPAHSVLSAVVREERDLCRSEVFSALHDHYETMFCRENNKSKEDLKDKERAAIFDQSFRAHDALVRNLGGSALDQKVMRAAISTVSAAAATEPDEESAEQVSDEA